MTFVGDNPSPRPWRVCGRAEGTKYGESYIEDAKGKSLTTSDGFFMRPDDSDLIVRAVNVHADLVAAIRRLLDTHGEVWRVIDGVNQRERECLCDACQEARAVLIRATDG